MYKSTCYNNKYYYYTFMIATCLDLCILSIFLCPSFPIKKDQEVTNLDIFTQHHVFVSAYKIMIKYCTFPPLVTASSDTRVQTLTCCSAAGASQSPGRACCPRARWRGPVGRPRRGRCSCCRSPGPAGSSGARSRTGSGRYRSSRCSCPWSSWTCCQSAPWRRSNLCGAKTATNTLVTVFHVPFRILLHPWNLVCITGHLPSWPRG